VDVSIAKKLEKSAHTISFDTFYQLYACLFMKAFQVRVGQHKQILCNQEVGDREYFLFSHGQVQCCLSPFKLSPGGPTSISKIVVLILIWLGSERVWARER